MFPVGIAIHADSEEVRKETNESGWRLVVIVRLPDLRW
jgi:hypothetical protein